MDWHLYVGIGVVALGIVGLAVYAIRPAKQAAPKPSWDMLFGFMRRPMVKPFDPVARAIYDENAGKPLQNDSSESTAASDS